MGNCFVFVAYLDEKWQWRWQSAVFVEVPESGYKSPSIIKLTIFSLLFDIHIFRFFHYSHFSLTDNVLPFTF